MIRNGKDFRYWVRWREAPHCDFNFNDFGDEPAMLDFVTKLMAANPEASYAIVFGHWVALEPVEVTTKYRVKE